MHRDKKTGKFVSDNKYIVRASGDPKNVVLYKKHLHKCPECKTSWSCSLPTIMISHFMPFCIDPYFNKCEKCSK